MRQPEHNYVPIEENFEIHSKLSRELTIVIEKESMKIEKVEMKRRVQLVQPLQEQKFGVGCEHLVQYYNQDLV